ncbi:MAG: putative toxin-antitoxin system toxin component, PIN family [Rhodoferax sp.]|nr:putative toxin-antitoxin system toxin component, PIN family [Rhodoferax sp.]
MTRLVIDTNVVLDLWLFQDSRCQVLRQALQAGAVQLAGTPALREELRQVLNRPTLQPWLLRAGRTAAEVLTDWDATAGLCLPPPAAPVRCRDPDDQKFIDLAVAHRWALVSRDRAVLALRRRLLGLGVWVGPVWPGVSLAAD